MICGINVNVGAEQGPDKTPFRLCFGCSLKPSLAGAVGIFECAVREGDGDLKRAPSSRQPVIGGAMAIMNTINKHATCLFVFLVHGLHIFNERACK